MQSMVKIIKNESLPIDGLDGYSYDEICELVLDPIYIEDLKIDINTIKEYKSGDILSFLERAHKYDQEVINNKKLSPL